jgi:hypothetical protein
MAFTEPPMIHTQVFGPVLNEVGVEASYLLPLNWYSDLTFGLLNGDNETLFDSDSPRDLAYLVHYDNLWDVSDEISMRIGLSALTGNRGSSLPEPLGLDIRLESIRSDVLGLDFFLKWRPLQFGRYRSMAFQGEYVHATLDMDGGRSDPLHGFFLQWLNQFKRIWWIQARYGWFERPADLRRFFTQPADLATTGMGDVSGQRFSASLALVPTDFSAYKIQYNLVDLYGNIEHQIIGQINVTIGSHPAHKY